MGTIRRKISPEREEYTQTFPVKSRLYVIEFVAPVDNDIVETLERALDELRTTGAAEVTGRWFLTNSFNDAAGSLHTRRVKDTE